MRKNIAEVLGTFMLVFFGTGAVVTNTTTNGAVTLLGIALAFGLIVMVVIYILGDVSGAHLNPAVTVGLLAARRVPVSTAVPYIICQIVGALLASLLMHVLFPTDPASLGATLPGANVLPYQVFILETIVTFLLVFTVLNVTVGAKEKGITAAIAIGFSITVDILFAGPLTGASMNPARSIGPAVVSGHLEYLWIYIAAPVLGAVLAALVCAGVREKA